MAELVKRPLHPQPSADQLAEQRDRSIEMSLLMSGKFDAQIAELKKQREALEPVLKIADTLGAADKMRAEAEEYAVTTRAQAANELASAKANLARAAQALADAGSDAEVMLNEARAAAEKIAAEAQAAYAAKVCAADEAVDERRGTVEALEKEIAELHNAKNEAQSQLDDLLARLAAKRDEIAAALGLTAPAWAPASPPQP